MLAQALPQVCAYAIDTKEAPLQTIVQKKRFRDDASVCCIILVELLHLVDACTQCRLLSLCHETHARLRVLLRHRSWKLPEWLESAVYHFANWTPPSQDDVAHLKTIKS